MQWQCMPWVLAHLHALNIRSAVNSLHIGNVAHVQSNAQETEAIDSRQHVESRDNDNEENQEKGVEENGVVEEKDDEDEKERKRT